MATAVVSGKPEVGVAIKNPDVERSPGPWCFSPLCHKCGLRCCSEGSLRVLVNLGWHEIAGQTPQGENGSLKQAVHAIHSVGERGPGVQGVGNPPAADQPPAERACFGAKLMADDKKPRALTYTEMMNKGRQHLDAAEGDCEQELQRSNEAVERNPKDLTTPQES